MRRGVRVVCSFYVAILLVAMIAAPGWGQTFRGTILGTVTDSSGAAVPGATVTINNTDTGLIRTTDSTGRWQLHRSGIADRDLLSHHRQREDFRPR